MDKEIQNHLEKRRIREENVKSAEQKLSNRCAKNMIKQLTKELTLADIASYMIYSEDKNVSIMDFKHRRPFFEWIPYIGKCSCAPCHSYISPENEYDDRSISINKEVEKSVNEYWSPHGISVKIDRSPCVGDDTCLGAIWSTYIAKFKRDLTKNT